MNAKGVFGLFVFLAVVLFSYGSADAQVPDAVKDAAKKTKDVTVDAAKKVGVVVTDNLEKGADKTKDATVSTAKAVGKKSKKIGSHTIDVTENVAGETYEGGKWFMVTTWDGTKWVSKRTWYATKKVADKIN